MKKVLCLFLSAVMLLSVTAGLSFTAYADTEGAFTYSVSGGKATITGYDGADTELVIPDKLGGNPVTAIGDSVFDDCDNLISVTIPDGVVSIGDAAFGYCDNLVKVDIPYSVSTISAYAFEGCKSLKRAFIRGTVSVIGERTFNGCESLEAVAFSSSLTAIGDSAFRNCSSLKEVYFAASKGDFEGDVTIGENNENFLDEGDVFYEYTNLGYCGDDVFYVYDTENSVLTLKGTGATADYSDDYPEFYASRGSITELVVESGLTVLNDGVFYEMNKVQKATLPDTLTKIGVSAFEKCAALKGITVPRSVTAIDKYAFNGCTALAKVNIFSFYTDIYSAPSTFPTDVTIYSCSGSAAEKYAEKFGFDFLAIGHKWGAWEIIEDEKPATCKADGVSAKRLHECSVCGVTELDGGNAIAKLNHDFSDNAEYCRNLCGTKNPDYIVPASADKKDNTLTVKAKKLKKFSFKTLKAKKLVIKRKKAIKVSGAKGAVTYKKVKNKKSKKILVNKKTGKITLKKGIKKGTYKVKIRVTAAGDDEYNPITKTVKVKIVVK